MSNNKKRPELVSQIDWALRELSAATVMAATSIAQKVGMGPNDLKCAELLIRNGPISAGELMDAAGLTSGAITGIVDRLEKAGWARREADSNDRRRIIVHPGARENEKVAAHLYAGHETRMGCLLSEYTGEQLAFILQFIQRLTAFNHEEAGKPAKNRKD